MGKRGRSEGAFPRDKEPFNPATDILSCGHHGFGRPSGAAFRFTHPQHKQPIHPASLSIAALKRAPYQGQKEKFYRLPASEIIHSIRFAGVEDKAALHSALERPAGLCYDAGKQRGVPADERSIPTHSLLQRQWADYGATSMKTIIKTERLFLREMTGEDYDALNEVLADSDIMQQNPYAFDEARVHGWIERNIERYHASGFDLWALCLRENGEMIGDCGLTVQGIKGIHSISWKESHSKFCNKEFVELHSVEHQKAYLEG